MGVSLDIAGESMQEFKAGVHLRVPGLLTEPGAVKRKEFLQRFDGLVSFVHNADEEVCGESIWINAFLFCQLLELEGEGVDVAELSKGLGEGHLVGDPRDVSGNTLNGRYAAGFEAVSDLPKKNQAGLHPVLLGTSSGLVINDAVVKLE